MATPDTGPLLPVKNGTLLIEANTAAGPVLADQLVRLTNGAPIVVQAATRTTDRGVVRVAGKAGLLGMSDMGVTVTTEVGNDGPVITARFTLIDGPAGPNAWRFSRSFPKLPPFKTDGKFDKRAGADTEPQGTDLLDRLALSDAAFVLTTAETGSDPVTGAPLAAGLNFVARCTPTGLLGLLGSAISRGGPVLLSGRIVVPKPGELTLPPPTSPLPRFPWEWPQLVPGIHLNADLGVDTRLGNKLRIHGLGLRIYSPTSREWAGAIPAYFPVLAAAAKIEVPSADISLDLTALGLASDRSVTLFGLFEGVSLGKLAQLADIAGANDLAGQLPGDVQKALDRLSGVSLEALSLQLGKGFTVEGVGITIGMRDIDTNVVPGLTVRKLLANFNVSRPFGPERSLSVDLEGDADFAGAAFAINVTLPEISAVARLTEGVTLPLGSLCRELGLPAVADLTIDDMQVGVTHDGVYSVAASMAADPGWKLDLGPLPLTVSDVRLLASRSRGGAPRGDISGRIALGDELELAVAYQIPGDFILRAELPDVRLMGLAGKLCNQRLSLPGGFDLELSDCSVLIQKTGAGLVFQLATTLAHVGTTAFEARKVGGGAWGFAFGIDLASPRPSALPGLAALKPFEEMFELDRLLLVVSSFDDPDFKFPALEAFNSPMVRGGALNLPASSGGVIAGLNLYTQWTIDTSKKEQKLLAKLLGLDPTIGVTLQVGENPAQNSRLYVSYKTTINKLPLSCQFGGQIKDGSLGLFLSGQMTVSIQGQNQTFDVTLLFVANGAFVSATAKGTTPIAFKFEGAKICELGNLALVIGANWEGIPSLGVAGTIAVNRFESSIAVFFDSAEPAKSMVAGSLSDLTLKDIVDTLTGSAIPSEIDGVLDRVAVKGTQAFAIPGALAEDLDNLKLEGVASAFAAKGVQIPSESQNVFLVVGERGSRWTLTDMTNKARHYQLVKQGADIQVSVEAQIYCVPQRTSIGALPPFDPDFYINGAISFFGFDASTTIDINPNQGIAVDGRMDRLVIGTEALFSLRSVQGDGGPRVSIATFTRPSEPEARFRPPHFYVNGHLEMLGLSREIYANLSAKGLEFDLNGDLLPAMRFDLHGTAGGPSYLGVGGGINVGVGTLDLGPLGKIDIGTGVDGKLDIQVSGSAISATMQGEFKFAGKGFKVPKFDLVIGTGALTGLAAKLYETVKKILLDFLKDAAAWAEFVGKGVITGVTDMAGALKNTYKVAANEAARLMRAAGRPAAEVGAGLKSAYGLTAQAAGAALKGAGYAANEVATGLKSAYNLSADAAAAVLKGLGYGANEVAGALKSVFGVTGQAAATILRAIGFGANAVAGALKSVFDFGADAVKSALGAAGYAANEVANAVGSFFKDIGKKLDPRNW